MTLRKRTEEAARDAIGHHNVSCGVYDQECICGVDDQIEKLADAIETEAKRFAEQAISEFYFQHTPLLAGEKLGTVIADAIAAAEKEEP